MISDPVRWGIMGTANIARRSFLPALDATDDGQAFAVASRDLSAAQSFAGEHGLQRAVEGYNALVDDDDVEAIYIPLPNSLHASPTVAALRRGKPVLCEKPLCVSTDETETVLSAARDTRTPLWEAFVFPFQLQMARVRDLIAGGALGDVREVQSTFHFRLNGRGDIRLSADLAGGALNDVGCYCVALARLVFAAEPIEGMATARWSPEGVDEGMAGILGFSDARRLIFSCAMDLRPDTFARIVCSEGEIRLTNPFHPIASDALEVHRGGDVERYSSDQNEPSFTPALRHINRVVRALEGPVHLAVDEAMGNSIGLDLLHRSARSGCLERV